MNEHGPDEWCPATPKTDGGVGAGVGVRVGGKTVDVGCMGRGEACPVVNGREHGAQGPSARRHILGSETDA